jgi:hypothetical protein|tara:strand:+ start:788 stop:1000 length:213 start_codon:yes stop_codon:yes gene_type:complete
MVSGPVSSATCGVVCVVVVVFVTVVLPCCKKISPVLLFSLGTRDAGSLAGDFANADATASQVPLHGVFPS